MADRSRDFYQALVQIDERFDADAIQANGAGATDGTYTQSGPRAGVPADQGSSAMVLQATGTPSQDGHLEVVASRAGMPDDRAEFIWRDVDGGDGTDDYKGWDGPELVTGWESLKAATASTTNQETYLAAITLQSGDVLAVTGQNGTSSGGQFALYLSRYSAASGWSALSNVNPGNGENQPGVALLQTIDGAVQMYVVADGGAQIDVLKSTDDGDSWAPMSLRVLEEDIAVADIKKISAAVAGNDILLFVSYVDGSANYQGVQYASTDMGKSFYRVGSAAFSTDSPDSDEVEGPAVVGLGYAGFIAAWRDRVGARYRCARIPNAGTAIATSAFVNLGDANNSEDCALALYRRPAGDVLVSFHRDGTAYGDLHQMRSIDQGDTWDDLNTAVQLDKSTAPNTELLYYYDYAECGGRGLLITRYKTGGTNSYDRWTTACLFLGGYSTQTAPGLDAASAGAYGEAGWMSWGQGGTSGTDGSGPWFPMCLPGDLADVSNGGAGGTEAITDSKATLSTTSADDYWEWSSTLAGGACCEASFAVISGGSASTEGVGLEVVRRNGSSHYKVTVRASTTAWALYDEGGSPTQIGSNVTIDMTTPLRIRVLMDTDGTVQTFYARDGHIRTWTAGPSGSATSIGSVLDSRLRFGHTASVTASSEWYFAGFSRHVLGRWAPRSTNTVFSGWTNPTDLRGVPASGTPRAITDGVSVAAVDGPACVDDAWDIRADYAYPISAMLPSSKSSPNQPWRSVADNTEMLIPFDPEPIFSGNAVAEAKAWWLSFHNCNVKQLIIEGYNGSAWSTVLQLDAFEFFDGLKYSRVGRILAPDTGQTQTAERYFFRELHAGDTFDFGTSDPVVLRKIAHNKEGAWTNQTTVIPALVMESDDLDGTEPSSGTGSVWRRDFGGVVYQLTDYQMWRIKIPAHKTADGYYQIGAFVIGAPVLFGTPTDRGFSHTTDFLVDYGESPAGRRSFRRRGPPRRSLEFAMANTAIDLNNVQADSPVPDYVTPDGTSPIAAVADTSRQVEGVIRRCTELGLPTVYVSRLDKLSGATSELITEPLRMLYGRLRTNPRRDHVVGNEFESEVERLNTVVVEEEL